MTLPIEVVRLIETFDRNIETYRQAPYNETQLRREFIDPFFKALGWDIDNTQGYAEAYKDVIHEDAIRVGGATKAPDYCFRIGGTRKFFLEAKKPSVNIKDDLAPAYQLRRYAWSAKLPLSILTDFEELAVSDCRVRPNKTDKPSKARILYFTYDQYADHWAEIASIFSRDAVLKGSFDKYAVSKRKQGTAEVDAAFLAEIETWRDKLARNIALRNEVSSRELNFAVQRTIDRIIFLRICEDRGIEPYGQLQGFLGGTEVYARLVALFRRADDRYNSGLFHFMREKDRTEGPDELTPELAIDDKPLKEILRSLYYPDSPYEFSVLPPEILGHVYEQFLGKVIRLTAGGYARIEDKPEVKKAGGVYYTPSYIVDYIVEHTVGKLLEGASVKFLKTRPPRLDRPLRVLDPACGSGSFLLGAYQKLLDWYRDYYENHDPQQWAASKQPPIYQAGPQGWKLTTAERKRILLDHIYGVDIDTQAVEVTKLSLLLRVLEGEKNLVLFHNERALPDLADNIKCGNSLIGPDFYEGKQFTMFDDDERLRINALDWHAEFPHAFKDGGFDAVIGNPPYGASISKTETAYLSRTFSAQSYQLDSYQLFMEQSLALLCDGGLFGMIMPNTWLSNILGKPFRTHVFMNYRLLDIVHYLKPVFRNVTVDTEIVIAGKTYRPEQAGVSITIVGKDGHIAKYNVEQDKWADGQPVNIFRRAESECIVRKMEKWGHLNDVVVITQGCKPFQVGKGKPPQTRQIVDKKPFVATHCPDSTFRPLLRGSLMHRYEILWKNNYYISFGDWLAEPRYSAGYDAAEKIVIRQTGDSLIATLDREQFVVRDNLYTILADDETTDLRFILGCLNSTLLNWYYGNVLNCERGEALAQVKRAHIARLPIRRIDLADPYDVSRHDRMVGMVEGMLSLHASLSSVKTADERNALQRQIDATDAEIDRLVYALYGLTDDEIKIVEEATR